MKHYILYTSDGNTEDMEGNAVENLQILAFQAAVSPKAAVAQLLKDWEVHGEPGHFEEVLVRELKSMESECFDIVRYKEKSKKYQTAGRTKTKGE